MGLFMWIIIQVCILFTSDSVKIALKVILPLRMPIMLIERLNFLKPEITHVSNIAIGDYIYITTCSSVHHARSMYSLQEMHIPFTRVLYIYRNASLFGVFFSIYRRGASHCLGFCIFRGDIISLPGILYI